MDIYNRSRSSPRTSYRRVLLCLCLAACVTGLWADWGATDASSFYFPRFVSSPGLDSGLALFNPALSDAVASLTLIDAQGVAADPVTVTVPAQGQIALTGSQLFGTSELNASLRVTSPTPGLYAVYSTFDTAYTFMDATGGAQSALQLIFPVAPGSAAKSMEIVLRNASTKNGSVDLKLWSLKGTAIASEVIPIAAGASIRASLACLMPTVSDFSSASHLTAASRAPGLFSEGQQPFYGTSVFGGAPALPAGNDAAALNAFTLTQTFTSGVFPYYRTGSKNFSVVSIANVEPASVDVTFTAVRNDGSNVGTKKVTVGGNGGLRDTVQALFPALASGEQEGWMLVQSTGRIAAHLLYGRSDVGSLSAVPLQKAPQYRFVFPQAVQNATYDTEISLANPGPNAADADVYVITPAGVTLASNRFYLTAGKRISFRVNEVMPELPEVPGGLIAVMSSEPLFATASIWAAQAGTVVNFEPVPVPASYQPALLASFAVTGKVTLNGKPAEGFQVVLSGPVGNVTTTAQDGSYMFTGLPAGKYSMTVDQYGFQFIPAVTNFQITTYSIRQNFQGFTEPNSIVVQPASIPVGSPDLTVRIFGADFNSTSQAWVGTTRLKTTFVDSTQLLVVVPGYMTELPARFDIIIETVGSSGTRVSKPYPIVAFVNRPELTSASTVGDVMEGNSSAVLDIQGSGFMPGLKVKVNGKSDGIEINQLNDTQIVARVPASYLQIGGIYPVTVENPYPSNAESNIQLMTVFFPTPAAQYLEPAVMRVQLEESAGPIQIDVFGYQYRRGAVVWFDDDYGEDDSPGVPLPTVYCEVTPACLSEHLIARIPPEYLRRSGFAKIWVQNPNPSLEGSEALFLRIEGLQPTITSVMPGSGTVLDLPLPNNRYTMPIVVNGTNIGPQTEVRIYKQPCEVLPEFSQENVVIVGPTQLYVYDWEVSYPESLGEWTVEIKNPQPGGGKSEPANFLISEGNFVPNPFVISINPEAVTSGSPGFTLFVNGVNFKEGSRVNFSSTQLATAFVSAKQLRAEVPASLIRSAGRRPISVTNPDNGGTSNRLFLEVK